MSDRKQPDSPGGLRRLWEEMGHCIQLCLVLLPLTSRRTLILASAGLPLLSLSVMDGRCSPQLFLLVGLVQLWLWLKHPSGQEGPWLRYSLPLAGVTALVVAILLWRELFLSALVVQVLHLLSLLPELWKEGFLSLRIPGQRPMFSALLLHVSVVLLPVCGLLLSLHPEHTDFLLRLAHSLMLGSCIAASGVQLLGSRSGCRPRWWPILLDKCLNTLLIPWVLLHWSALAPWAALLACALWILGEWDSTSLVELWRRCEMARVRKHRRNVEQDLL